MLHHHSSCLFLVRKPVGRLPDNCASDSLLPLYFASIKYLIFVTFMKLVRFEYLDDNGLLVRCLGEVPRVIAYMFISVICPY
jgi:hypothetical protein